PARAHRHIPRIVLLRHVRNLALFCVDCRRAHCATHQGPGLTSPVPGMGIPMDSGGLWYHGVRYCCKSLAGSPSPILYRTRDNPAWNPVFPSLAQARYSTRQSTPNTADELSVAMFTKSRVTIWLLPGFRRRNLEEKIDGSE